MMPRHALISWLRHATAYLVYAMEQTQHIFDFMHKLNAQPTTISNMATEYPKITIATPPRIPGRCRPRSSGRSNLMDNIILLPNPGLPQPSTPMGHAPPQPYDCPETKH